MQLTWRQQEVSRWQGSTESQTNGTAQNQQPGSTNVTQGVTKQCCTIEARAALTGNNAMMMGAPNMRGIHNRMC